MSDVVANYSPNQRWGKQIVEVTVKQWRYARTFTVKVGGNCLGFVVFKTAVGIVLDQIEFGDDYRLELTAPDGKTLRSDFSDDDRGHDPAAWLGAAVVSIRIIGWEPPTLNEVRAMNGAKPRPDGDVAWDPM